MADQTRKRKKALKAVKKAVRKAVKKGVTRKTVEDAVGRALIEARKSGIVERKTKLST